MKKSKGVDDKVDREDDEEFVFTAPSMFGNMEKGSKTSWLKNRYARVSMIAAMVVIQAPLLAFYLVK